MASADEGLADVAILATLNSSVLTLFLRLLSGEPPVEARRRENNCVYNTAVVMWLMITQRLQAQGSMATAVLELPGLPASLWPNPCRRRQPGEGPMSSNTGAYNKARQRLPAGAVEGFCVTAQVGIPSRDASGGKSATGFGVAGWLKATRY